MRIAPLFVLLAACTGKEPDSSTGDSSPDTTTGDDTGPSEPTPVWEDHIETSSTLNGLYASGAGLYVAGTGGVVLTSQDIAYLDGHVAPGRGDDIGDLWGMGSGETLVLVVGAGSGLLARWQSGAWTVDDVETASGEGVGGSSGTAVFVVTWGGAHFWDGSSWAFETAPGNPKLNDVYANASDAVAVGEGGAATVRTGGQLAVDGQRHERGPQRGQRQRDERRLGGGRGRAWLFHGRRVVDLHQHRHGGGALGRVGGERDVRVRRGERRNGDPRGRHGVDGAAHGRTNNLYAVHGSAANNVYAGGNRGALLRYGG